MPRTHALAWAELKIGLLTVSAIAMATLLIFLLSGAGGFFWQRYSLKTIFPSVPGLLTGAPVRVAGVEVGSVTEVTFAGDRVEVVMSISRDMQSRVTSTSSASLGSVSLVGEAAIDITASSRGTPIPEWGYVAFRPAAGSVTGVITQTAEGVEEFTGLLQDIRSGQGLYSQINAVVEAAEIVVRNVSEGHGTLGRLTNDPTAAQALEASLQNFEAVTARIKAGEGSLGKLLNDDALAKTLASTTANLDSITDRINRGEGTAGKLVVERELYDRLNSTSERLDKVMTGLQQGEGTAGQLLQDRQLYENMNEAIAELQQLIQDIRADPEKFLTVRFSLF